MEFYTASKILSKKFEKGLFGYKQTQDYKIYGYTLHNTVFDLTEIGQDPIKLLSSILLHTTLKEMIDIDIDHYFSDKLLYDVNHDHYDLINIEKRMNGFIYCLNNLDSKLEKEKIVVQLLTEFLGAKYYSYNNSMYKTSIWRRSHIFGNRPIRIKPFEKLVEMYSRDSKIFKYHVEYSNAVSRYIKLNSSNT